MLMEGEPNLDAGALIVSRLHLRSRTCCVCVCSGGRGPGLESIQDVVVYHGDLCRMVVVFVDPLSHLAEQPRL